MVRVALSRGAALVTAMLIAALAAATVAALASGQSQWLRTVEARRDRAQAEAIVLAGLTWSRQVLEADARAGDLDHLGESWALPLPPTPLEGGVVEGVIVDAQGRLDLNHLAGEADAARTGRERLARLFAQTGLEPQALAAVVAAAAPAATSPEGTMAGERSWMRAAEVASLPALGEAGYARIAAYVTALPAPRPLNVNTAPPEVLATTVAGLAGDALAALVADRARLPFRSLADFRSRLPAGASVASDASLGVRSEFFLATVRARQGDSVARGRALIRRGTAGADVVWQTIE